MAVKVNGDSAHTGLCLEVHDLCAAKSLANRPKDHTYVAAMIQEAFVDPNVVWDRVVATDTDDTRIDAAKRWLLEPLSPLIVKTHENQSMATLEPRDRAQLVVAGYQSGLVRGGVPGD